MNNETKLITNEEEFILNKTKADFRILVNISLLGICFTIFTFIVAIKPELLIKNIFISLQLVCSIPLMMSSVFARSKQGYTIRESKWDKLGFITFVLGYSFMLNVVGLLLTSLVSFQVGLIFFLVNMFLAVVYSIIDVSYDHSRLKSRVIKDTVFIMLIIILGIIPSIIPSI